MRGKLKLQSSREAAGRGVFSAFSPAYSPPAFCLAPAACISSLSRACVIFDVHSQHGGILEIDSKYHVHDAHLQV